MILGINYLNVVKRILPIKVTGTGAYPPLQLWSNPLAEWRTSFLLSRLSRKPPHQSQYGGANPASYFLVLRLRCVDSDWCYMFIRHYLKKNTFEMQIGKSHWKVEGSLQYKKWENKGERYTFIYNNTSQRGRKNVTKEWEYEV